MAKNGTLTEGYSEDLIITPDHPCLEEPSIICREIAVGLSREVIIEVRG